MASPYTADNLSAVKLAGAIADDAGELAAGVATKVTSQTTLVIAHSFAAAPDFVMITPILKANAAPISPVANTTSVTLTRTTATSSWSVCYILGYTA